ncbi:MAG: Hsp33 family molecular chaperone [Epulopiscium sp. Nuni2H_MBin003]|nr:MAG: Hsp33 family molecular chaperone [Epulopiscium sp. Nuni2H_MBin003]
MEDYVIRGINRSFRVFGANTTQLVSQLATRHATTPVATAALGRTLTAATIMGQMSKNSEDRISILIKGDGPIGGIVVEANGRGNAKGYVYNPDVDIEKNAKGKLNVAGAIGNAIMTVSKDIGLKEPYIGQTAMLSGEIAEDIADYFMISEQVNSVVILGVLVNPDDYTVKASGGIIIQVLPDAQEEDIDKLESKITEFSSLTECLEKGQSIEEVINTLLEDVTILSKIDVKFNCDCSKDKMERALISLGKKELTDIVQDDQPDLELVCHFCNEKYQFDKKAIKDVVDTII